MPKIYTTVEGDSFDLIALRFYRSDRLASLIMQANPDHMSTLIFDAGVKLSIPDRNTDAKPATLPPWRRST